MIYISSRMNYDKTERGEVLNVRHAAYTNVQTGWSHRDRFLTADELILVTAGCVHIMVNGVSYDIRENEFLLLPKYCSISATRKSNSTCSFYSVSFESSLDLLKGKMNIKQRLSGNIVFLHELLKRMVILNNSGKDNPAEYDSLFLTFLYEIDFSAGEEPGNAELFMQKILDYIHANVNLPISIEDLCEQFNYSRDYLSKQFRKHYNISIKSYVNQVKIETAKQLLSTSRMSIEQVGNAVGFDSVQLFYKFFRYHENMTPTAYRKLYR